MLKRHLKADMDRPVLSLSDLCLQLGTDFKLHHVSLQLPAGQIGGLIGANGAGKTTVLRCIAGLESRATGSILINQRTLQDEKRFLPAHLRRVGYVFQDLALFDRLSTSQNLAFGIEGSFAQRSTKAESLLQQFRLETYRDTPVAQLSGGMRQRVAIARALGADPDLLLLDEPFSSCDIEEKKRLMRFLRQLIGDQGLSSLLVTHDSEVAIGICDYLGVMDQGRLIAQGSAQSIYEDPPSLKVALSLGSASCLEAHIAEDGLTAMTALGSVGLIRATAQKHGSVLLRDEDVRLAGDVQPNAKVIFVQRLDGGRYRCTLHLEALTQEVDLITEHPLTIGSVHGLALRPKRYTFFPADQTISAF